MKILTIVGARPQFIKAAAMSRLLKKEHDEIILHTGQHFDVNMSDIFFDELEIPVPRYNLNISGGSHGIMTGRMLMGIEEVLQKEKPEAVLLYGDTNSTLAGALAAAKLNIPVIHIEAGNRFGKMSNPEEINRIVTDHLSSLLFPASESAMNFLIKEGLGEKSYMVGNVMYDAFLYFSDKAMLLKKNPLDYNGCPWELPSRYCYMTCHRQENTADDKSLMEIFKATDMLDMPTIYPVHPRNQERALRLKQKHGLPKLKLIPPVGYLESVNLTKHASLILTDSGGLQCEAFYAEVKCVTILDFVVWPETLIGNRNTMSAPKADEIIEKLNFPQEIDPVYQPFGDGHACDKIMQIIAAKSSFINK